MTKEEAKKYLKELYNKVDLSRSIRHSIYSPNQFYFLSAIKMALEALENCNKELPSELKERLEKEKTEAIKRERERTIKNFQNRCDHEWGPVEWTWCCGGYRTCIKCGLTEDYYERD